jgi:hypothetical protein
MFSAMMMFLYDKRESERRIMTQRGFYGVWCGMYGVWCAIYGV